MVIGNGDITGAKKLVREWADDRSMKLDEASQKNDDMSFVFNGVLENGIPFAIIQPTDLKNAIVVLAQVVPTQEHLKMFESMKEKEAARLEKFTWSLKKDLMFKSALFAFDPGFDTTGIPSGIQFTHEICFDGLTEDRLNSAVRDVGSSALWAIWAIRRELDGPIMKG